MPIDIPLGNVVTSFTTHGESAVVAGAMAVDKNLNQVRNTGDSLRNTFLFLSFGMLAAGGMMSRMGKRLTNLSDTMRDTYAQIEFGSVVVGTMLGNVDESMKEVMETAIRLGRETERTAQDAVDAMRRLAMAGFDTAETMGSVEAVLKLATIAEVDAAAAAELAAGVFRSFGFEAQTAADAAAGMTEVVSMLAAAASSSAATAGELAEALKFVGVVAQEVGYTVESVLSALMIGADNMVKAGIAGRGLRMSLLKLSGRVEAMNENTLSLSEAMRKYNLELSDAQGNLKPLPDLVDEFSEKLGDLTQTEKLWILQQLTTVRGSTLWLAMMQEGGDALRQNEAMLQISAAREAISTKTREDSITVLKRYRSNIEDSASGLQWLVNEMGYTVEEANTINDAVFALADNQSRWNTALEESKELSAITAARLETLAGTQLLLKSSMDALWASLAEGVIPVFTTFNQIVRSLADWLSTLPGPIKAIIALLVLATGVILTILGAMFKWAGTIFMLNAAIAALDKKEMKNIGIMGLWWLSIKNISGASRGLARDVFLKSRVVEADNKTIASHVTLLSAEAAQYNITSGAVMTEAVIIHESTGAKIKHKLATIGQTITLKLNTIALKISTAVTVFHTKILRMATTGEALHASAILSKTGALRGQILVLKISISATISRTLATIKDTIATKLSAAAEWIRTHSLLAAIATTAMLTAKILFNTIALGANLALIGMHTAATITWAAAKWVATAATGVLTTAMWALNAAMYANPLVWIIAGIAGLIAIIYLLITNLDKVVEVFSKLASLIGGFFKSVLDGIVSSISFLVGLFQSLRDIIEDTLGTFWDMASGVGALLGNSIIPDYVEHGVGEIGDSFKKMEGMATNFTQNVTAAVGPSVIESPITNPPVIEPPITNLPITNPPITNLPITNPPVIEPPIIEPPIIESPIINPLAIETSPVIEPPVNESSSLSRGIGNISPTPPVERTTSVNVGSSIGSVTVGSAEDLDKVEEMMKRRDAELMREISFKLNKQRGF